MVSKGLMFSSAQLSIGKRGMGDESMTSIIHFDDFYANLLFDALFIDRCAHIWVSYCLKKKKFGHSSFHYNWFILKV